MRPDWKRTMSEFLVNRPEMRKMSHTRPEPSSDRIRALAGRALAGVAAAASAAPESSVLRVILVFIRYPADPLCVQAEMWHGPLAPRIPKFSIVTTDCTGR